MGNRRTGDLVLGQMVTLTRTRDPTSPNLALRTQQNVS